MSFKDFLNGAIPIAASFIPGIGQIAGPLAGAAMGATGGGGWKGAVAGGLAGLTGAQLASAMKGANADSKKAHAAADRSTALAEQASATANKQFDLGAPMRDAFRFGSLNFNDPSNPFSRNDQFAQFRAGLRPEVQPMAKAGLAGMLQKATAKNVGREVQ